MIKNQISKTLRQYMPSVKSNPIIQIQTIFKSMHQFQPNPQNSSSAVKLFLTYNQALIKDAKRKKQQALKLVSLKQAKTEKKDKYSGQKDLLLAQLHGDNLRIQKLKAMLKQAQILKQESQELQERKQRKLNQQYTKKDSFKALKLKIPLNKSSNHQNQEQNNKLNEKIKADNQTLIEQIRRQKKVNQKQAIKSEMMRQQNDYINREKIIPLICKGHRPQSSINKAIKVLFIAIILMLSIWSLFYYEKESQKTKRTQTKQNAQFFSSNKDSVRQEQKKTNLFFYKNHNEQSVIKQSSIWMSILNRSPTHKVSSSNHQPYYKQKTLRTHHPYIFISQQQVF